MSKEDFVYLAKIAEQAERYDEMVKYTNEAAKQCTGELDLDDRNLLSVAYKNVVGNRRAAWRVLNSIHAKEMKKGDPSSRNVQNVYDYKKKIEAELDDLCKSILALLEDNLIPKSKSAEAQVFFLKMKGDYHRYIAEYASPSNQADLAEEANQAYKRATDVATNDLEATHPIRLGLALNYSVFYYEIKQNPEKACEMAKKAFDDAIADLDNVQEAYYKDSTLIMQLLRDNLTLWTSDVQEA